MAAKVTKVSLSLDSEALAWAARRAQDIGSSVSSVVSEALEATRVLERARARRAAAWKRFLADSGVPAPTRAELDDAWAELTAPATSASTRGRAPSRPVRRRARRVA